MDRTEVNVMDHLAELRKRIIVTLVVCIFFFIVAFVFVKHIYQFLVRDFDEKLALLGPADILWVYMVIAGVVAIAGIIPVAAFQIWRFVKPGLTKQEQRITLMYIPGLFLLFVSGVAFGYFVLFPLVLSFLQDLAGSQFEMVFTVEKYFRFMFNLTVPLGFLFEMPAVMMFLTSIGVLNPEKLQQGRKYAYFLLIVLSVLVTPPDFVSDIVVIIPLLLLYELSITISKIVFRKRSSAEKTIVAEQ